MKTSVKEKSEYTKVLSIYIIVCYLEKVKNVSHFLKAKIEKIELLFYCQLIVIKLMTKIVFF